MRWTLLFLTFTMMVGLHAQDTDQYCLRGIQALRRQQCDLAIQSFDSLQLLYPEKTEPLFNKGLSLLCKKDFSNALKAFDQILQSSPGDEDAIFLKAYCLKNSGNLPAAKELIKQLPIDHRFRKQLEAEIQEPSGSWLADYWYYLLAIIICLIGFGFALFRK